MSVEFFEKKTGIIFKNKRLLDQALTHSSHRSSRNNNERLEFLGDAVLKILVSTYLYQKYPHYSEGDLTKLRSKIVSDRMLAKIASDLDLGYFLKISASVRLSESYMRSSVLADTFEALMGGFYLDQGLEATERVFLPFLVMSESLLKKLDVYDYKSTLQEYMQKSQNDLPKYLLIKTSGPEHDISFYSSVEVQFKGKVYIEEGQGRSKKESEQFAAKKLLQKLSFKFIDHDECNVV